MADFTLDDLNAITETVSSDLFHIRNTSGLDKKITQAELFAQILSPVNHIRQQTFAVTSSGWYTVLRTTDRFAAKLQISAAGANNADVFTILVHRGLDTTDDIVRVLDAAHLEGYPISKIRYGNAGAGDGICVQVYVDMGADSSITVKTKAFGADTLDTTGVGVWDIETNTDEQTDYDDNSVSSFTTWPRLAFGELIRAGRFSYLSAGDVTIDGSTVTRIEPGIYNNVQFTGNGAMGVGRYIILGDFTVDTGITVTIDPVPSEYTSRPGAGVKEQFRAWFGETGVRSGSSLSTAAGSGYGGDGGQGDAGVNNGGGGGAGPCGSASTYDIQGTVYGLDAGGWVVLNVIGIFTNDGTINLYGSVGIANDIDSNTASGGSGGGAFVARSLSDESSWGTINAYGGDGGNDTYDGGGGGGGVIETYGFDDGSSLVANVAGGDGPGDATAGENGTAAHTDLSDYPDQAGAPHAFADMTHVYNGFILEFEGGWWAA